MSAEVTIALGVAGRVLANIAFVDRPRLGAALVGISNGFLLHRAWVTNSLLEPLTLLVLAAYIVFDHSMYGEFEGTVTALLGCGLGVVLADFGPDLWYEIVGEQFTKDIARELESVFPFLGDDSASDVDDRSDVGSVVSKVSGSSRRTSRSNRTGTSVTVRPSRPGPRPLPPASTITRSSRVTFDESSISQSQASDLDVDELSTTEVGLTNGATTEFVRDTDVLSESVPPSANDNGTDYLYMEPSTMGVGSSHTRIQMTTPSSVLRRLDVPEAPSNTTSTSTTITMPVPQSASSQVSGSTHTRLTSEGEMTPRPMTSEFSSMPHTHGGFEPLPPHFPEPELSNGYSDYSPRVIPPSEPTPDLSAFIPLPGPAYFPPAAPEQQHYHQPATENEGEYEPSRLSRILNVPIVSPSETEQQNQNHHKEYPDSPMPESARLWAPPQPRASSATSRSRSRSPAGPRPQHPIKEDPAPPPVDAFGSPSYISETYEDPTVDVRNLDRNAALSQIEDAWKLVEKKRHRRLNVLVRHDDDELRSGKDSTFHLMADLENLRFNFKIRPGIIIITSRSRG